MVKAKIYKGSGRTEEMEFESKYIAKQYFIDNGVKIEYYYRSDNDLSFMWFIKNCEFLPVELEILN